MEDPRKILHSKFTHGLLFNLLYKSVHGSFVNDFVTSLAVHLLELAVTFPQKEGFSGKVSLTSDYYKTHWEGYFILASSATNAENSPFIHAVRGGGGSKT
jgi:hypothetical protein